MVEVHDDPDHALSDGPQSLFPAQFAAMVAQLREILPVVHRTLNAAPNSKPDSTPAKQASAAGAEAERS
jgi:3-deoxy-7-phosphoheptulonate synthase